MFSVKYESSFYGKSMYPRPEKPFTVAKAGSCHHPRGRGSILDQSTWNLMWKKKRDNVASFSDSMSVSSVSIIQHPHVSCFMSKARGVKQEP